MSSDVRPHDAFPAIRLTSVSKCYQIYRRPEDRLKQAVLPRLQRVFGSEPRRYFDEFWALQPVTLEVRRGETVAIIGRNGSGKSTLLKLLCGTLTPTSGAVELEGRVAALLELGSGFNPEFTGRENVFLNASILGLSRAEVVKRFDAIAAFADIGEHMDQPVKTYSSGMYVRLAFAVMANVDAEILVVDEALSVGDAFFAQKCMRFLRDFQARGTLVFVSHDANAVVNLCDRAVWLEAGHVVMDGPAKGVSEAYHAKLYGMDVAALSDGLAPESEETAAEVQSDASRLSFFSFDAPSASFGDGRARLERVAIEGLDGTPLVQVEGGVVVRIVVEAAVDQTIDRPIVGFFWKDRLGQRLFGANTFLAGVAQPPVYPGSLLRTSFQLRLPHLPNGRYTLDIAIADGDQHQHVQAIWAFDALVIQATASTVVLGLLGLPLQSVRLEALPR